MGKTATLNLRVNPDVKENAESVLEQLGILLPNIMGKSGMRKRKER